MTEWNDEIIIVRMGHFHEIDVWAKVLSRSKGLITVFAFGGLKSRHRFSGCLDLFNTLKCRIKVCGRGAYLNLQEAELEKAPITLRSNWRKMGIAANCLLFLQSCQISEESSKECFALLENVRTALEHDSPISSQFPFYFRLRFLTALGFAPDFRECGNCATIHLDSGLFLAGEGRVFCPDCANSMGNARKRGGEWLDKPSLEHLSLVQSSMPQFWNDFSLQENEKRACGRAINSFAQYYM